MDEKRLNIEAPLLSVRRSASSQKTLDKKQILLYPKSDSTIKQLTEPVTVPFNWENILGRSKPKEDPVTPSPTFSKETEHDNDDDDVYSDALDTIMSPPESVLMNCSVSGISGLDHSSVNKSGTFHTDQKIRDFMMNRFLPAAKAMTVQVPEYTSTSRKQSVVVEQAREINRSFREEKKLMLKNYISDIIQSSNRCETEEESEDDKYESSNVSAKGCGLLSQLRIKNSLCLLNPVPGMKLRNIVPMPSAFEAAKPNKGSHVRSYSPAPVVRKAIDAIYKNKLSSEAASMDTSEVRKKWMSQSCRFTCNSGESQQQESSQGGKEALEEKNMLDSDTNNKQIVIASGESSESVLCPVPPPLPKSPSESWLWRALPLVSVRNPLNHSNLSNHSQSINHDSHTTSSNDTKWETIVKTSNLHDHHVRYSQEIITTHKSQRLKS